MNTAPMKIAYSANLVRSLACAPLALGLCLGACATEPIADDPSPGETEQAVTGALEQGPITGPGAWTYDTGATFVPRRDGMMVEIGGASSFLPPPHATHDNQYPNNLDMTGWLSPMSDGSTEIEVRVSVGDTHLAPGTYAVEIRDHWNCLAPGLQGNEWNPTNKHHGKWGSANYRLGGLGNIKIESNGWGVYLLKTARITSEGTGPNNALGKVVVLYSHADDFSQPDGHVGAPIACAYIYETNPSGE